MTINPQKVRWRVTLLKVYALQPPHPKWLLHDLLHINAKRPLHNFRQRRRRHFRLHSPAFLHLCKHRRLYLPFVKSLPHFRRHLHFFPHSHSRRHLMDRQLYLHLLHLRPHLSLLLLLFFLGFSSSSSSSISCVKLSSSAKIPSFSSSSSSSSSTPDSPSSC